jgi:hypothetical protein
LFLIKFKDAGQAETDAWLCFWLKIVYCKTLQRVRDTLREGFYFELAINSQIAMYEIT